MGIAATSHSGIDALRRDPEEGNKEKNTPGFAGTPGERSSWLFDGPEAQMRLNEAYNAFLGDN
jgi:hypothetical protein